MIFALKITGTEENTFNLLKWNGGIQPAEDCINCYCITWTDSHLDNLIREEEDFLLDFKFVNKEIPNEWSEVLEL